MYGGRIVNITEVAGQVVPYKRISFTNFKVAIPRNACVMMLKDAWAKADILKAWEAMSWAKNLKNKT